MGSLSLLQGIFPTQELNPGLPHCRRILYQLSFKERPACVQQGIKKLREHRVYSSVQLVPQSCPSLCNPWTAACQASLSITNPWSLLKLMSIESVMPSNHLTLCHPLFLPHSILPSIRVFSNGSSSPGGQSIGASASVLLMNIHH